LRARRTARAFSGITGKTRKTAVAGGFVIFQRISRLDESTPPCRIVCMHFVTRAGRVGFADPLPGSSRVALKLGGRQAALFLAPSFARPAQ
jgi:hypothetical protein